MSAATLDHVGLCTDRAETLWAEYERLGFTLTPVARQSGPRRPSAAPERLATGNRCAMLRQGYVELLGILEPGLFDNGIGGFVARYRGLHILAFGVEQAEAELPRLRRAGFDIAGVAPLQRPVDDAAPEGPLARFARLPMPDAPEGRLQLIEHLTPELLWQERWMRHPNHAVALEAAVLVSADPAESAARLSRLTGAVLEPDPVGGFALPLPQGRMRILPEAALAAVLPGVAVPALPFIAGFVLRTDDDNAAARRILAGLETREAPEGGLMVPPALAGGAALVFRP
ncbi:VOC family protein [Roseomonas marmotae]|uniref:VOC family protein n=1 Tax=Roseomonas marmotae TaxID=2768161 RepID=A0ABS3KCN1_9PROT|nr:VOC family protein [Roseomonas marmotae]MBO1075207.1 VOC family protein [Roseomonas marmotae]QTI79686.1 VOC family protein [Roseomonas marmotae]